MLIDRTIAPQISEITSFNILKAEKAVFDNGIPMYWLNSPDTDLIKIELMFRAGNWYQQTPLTAFSVNSMLIEGTHQLSSAQIAEKVEFYGASVGFNVDKDNAYVSVFTLHKYLQEVLPLLEDIVKNAVFPEQEIAMFRNKHKQQFIVDQTRVKSVARALHARMMFGNSHPYGYTIRESDFDSIQQIQLVAFYRQFYSSVNCTLIASGAISEKDIPVIAKYFGTTSWNQEISHQSVVYEATPEKERKTYIEKPDAMQSAVRIGKELFTRHHPDYAGMSVLNCILGGYFGSRLMRTIREEKGYTYGISSLLVTFTHSGYLSIVSELGTKVTKPAITEIYHEIERLHTERVPDEELERVKNYMLGEMLRMFDGSFAQAESLILLLENGLDYDYFNRFIQTIRNISADELMRLSHKYLAPESFFEVVVGKMES